MKIRRSISAWLVTALTLLLAPASAAQSADARVQADPLDVLARAATATGAPLDAAALGDIEFSGRAEGTAGVKRWRMSLRLQPPGLRHEIWGPGTGLDQPPSVVYVSSAHRAWRERPAGGRASRPGEIVAVLDRIHELRLLLRPLDFPGSVFPDPSGDTLPAVPGWPAPGEAPPAELAPGRPVHSFFTASASSLNWRVHFDRETGRLLGLDQPDTLTHPWVRLTGWRRFGALTLPARRIQGSEAFDPITTITEDVRTGLSLPDELFAGDPWTPRTTPADVAPLQVVPSGLPGSGYIVLPDVRIEGRATRTMFDTAADGLFLSPALVQQLRLGVLATQQTQTLFGSTTTSRHFIFTLDLGTERLFQIPAFSAQFPTLAEFIRGTHPQAVLGGWPIMQLHPVLDLLDGRLVSRGAADVPLGKLAHTGSAAGRTVFEVPLGGLADERGASILFASVRFAEGEVDLLLDTGFPFMARLSASGLRKLGLPTSREAWLRRGAATVHLAGAGPHKGSDLLVRTNALSFGPITHVHPYVLLAGLGDSPEAMEFPYDGLLGAAALLPFARIGFDGRRGVLELEVAGDEAERARLAATGFPSVQVVDAGARARVGDPGLFLGLFIDSPAPHATRSPDAFPLVLSVHKGSAAWTAGIRTGDHLLSIDGASAAGRYAGGCAMDLWAQPGRHLTLRLLRPEGTGDGSGEGAEYEVTLP